MLKIVFIVSSLYKVGGVQRVVSIIANSLVSSNVNVSIISYFKEGEKPVYNLNSKIEVDFLFTAPLDLRIHFKKVCRVLREKINSESIDILITAGMGLAPFSKISTIGDKNIRLIGWEHQQFYFGKKFGLEWLGKRIASYTMDAVVVLTNDDYKAYKENLKKINNITHIYNPIESEISEKDYNFNTKKIISVGSLISRKGFDMAIEVAKNVFVKHPDWQWDIYGEGPERKKLENKIKEYRLENNFNLKGFSDNIYKEYENYALYVMTSRNEGFPMTLIEAKANKLPIISFDCKNGPSEMIIDELNGNIISGFDINEMSNKIIDFITHKKKAEKYSENSTNELKMLNLDKITNQWIDLFKQVL